MRVPLSPLMPPSASRVETDVISGVSRDCRMSLLDATLLLLSVTTSRTASCEWLATTSDYVWISHNADMRQILFCSYSTISKNYYYLSASHADETGIAISDVCPCDGVCVCVCLSVQKLEKRWTELYVTCYEDMLPWNQSVSKATGIKNWGQIYDILPL